MKKYKLLLSFAYFFLCTSCIYAAVVVDEKIEQAKPLGFITMIAYDQASHLCEVKKMFASVDWKTYSLEAEDDDEGSYKWVFIQSDAVVGFAWCAHSFWPFGEPRAIRIEFFIVESSLRNRGIGSLCMDLLCQELVRKKYTVLRAEPVKKSISFYKRNGFKNITYLMYEKNLVTTTIASVAKNRHTLL